MKKRIFFFGAVLILCGVYIADALRGQGGAQDQGPVAVFDPATMDEVAVPLQRAPAGAEVLGDYGWPGVDFEDHGLIAREPVEEGLTGFPRGVEIEFYGAFQMSVARRYLRYLPEEAQARFWEPYDAELELDSMVSFINGRDRDGAAVFYFDSDNDEDFSGEAPVPAEDFVAFDSKLMWALSKVSAQVPQGVRAGATVEYEYQVNGRVATARAPVEVYRFTNYGKKRPDPTFPKFRGLITEFRRGRVEIGGEVLALAVDNEGEYGTYQARTSSQIVFDLDGDGVFNNDLESAECLKTDEPFSVRGVAMEVARISPLGDEVVLRRVGAPVAAKREIVSGMAAPAFAARDIAGNELSLADFRGRYVLLDFWGTGCAPCLRDTPLLQSLHEKFADELVILAISDDRDRAAVERYVAKNDIGWVQVLDVADNQGRLRKLYNVSGIPKYFLIDPEGKVAAGSSALRGLVEPVLEAWLL